MRDKLFVISQTGVGHLSADTSRSFSPCQDAYKIVDFPGVEVPDWDGSFSGTIIAVADGHGDPVYNGSSEFGSKLAVEAAVDCMLELLKGYEEDDDVGEFYEFPRMVVNEWRMRVLKHAKGRFPEKELRKRFSSEDTYENYMKRIYMDYGSTLLVTVVVPEKKLLIAAQIGDGDILMMYRADRKERVHRIVEGNSHRGFGSNLTDSLCMSHANEKFQMKILEGQEYPHDAKRLADFVLMVTTDGISKGALSEFHYLNDYCRSRMRAYMNAKNQAQRMFMQEYMEKEMETKMRDYSTDDMTVVFMAVNDRNGAEEKEYDETE